MGGRDLRWAGASGDGEGKRGRRLRPGFVEQVFYLRYFIIHY